MLRALIPAVAALGLMVSGAWAQLAPPVAGQGTTAATSLKCLLVPAALGKTVSALALGHCRTVCKGCGCNGGPGYRAPADAASGAGNCVGFPDINRVCGPPPHQKCAAECAVVRPECIGFGRAWLMFHAAEHGLQLAWREPDQPPAGALPPAEQPTRKRPVPPVAPAAPNGATPASLLQPPALSADGFKCGDKRICKDMASCEEAKFHYTQCGLTRLDGTGNGVPCKKLCAK